MVSRFLLETLPQNKKQMVATVSRKDGEALSERPIEVTLLWQPGCRLCVLSALVSAVPIVTAVCLLLANGDCIVTLPADSLKGKWRLARW
jgi:hypothetical protein